MASGTPGMRGGVRGAGVDQRRAMGGTPGHGTSTHTGASIMGEDSSFIFGDETPVPRTPQDTITPGRGNGTAWADFQRRQDGGAAGAAVHGGARDAGGVVRGGLDFRTPGTSSGRRRAAAGASGAMADDSFDAMIGGSSFEMSM